MNLRATAYRTLFVCLLIGAALFVWTDTAHAHGGRNKKPTEEPEEPEDPGPPPTPPPPDPDLPRGGGDPTTGVPENEPGEGDPAEGSDDPGITPPPTRPEGPTTGRGRPNTRGRLGGRARPSAANADGQWATWWNYNRWSYLPDRSDVARRRARTVTGEAIDPVEFDEAQRATSARREIVPLLLRLLHPRTRVPDEVRASAIIALAKLSNDSATTTLAFTYAHSRHESSMVRESAALAVGLLRRTDPALRMSGEELARVRARLFEVFDNETTPWRTRAFAMLALGLLGDQPFAEGLHRDGMLVSRGLWMRLRQKYGNKEMSVALLKALGLQPLGGMPESMRDDLRGIAGGRRVFRRRWSDVERSHALTALVRSGAPGWPVWLMRTLGSRQTPPAVQRAACIALGARATSLTAEERAAVARVWSRAQSRAHDPLTRGLLRLAQGRVLAADLATSSAQLLVGSRLANDLMAGAQRDPVAVRGFSTLALALAVRGAKGQSQDDIVKFAVRARAALHESFRKQRGGPDQQGAVAVALGLVGTRDGDPATRATHDRLRDVIEDGNAHGALRGYSAVALAHAAPRHPKLREALNKALWDRRTPELRSEAALALSFLPRKDEAPTLVRELRRRESSQWVLGQVAAALGRLADLRVVGDIAAVAADKSLSDQSRGIAVASLALIADPEPRPSLFRLTLDSNYPARTNALHEAFTIL